MGQHAKQYSDMGAESVLGIDISERMLEYAKEHFHAKNITYQQLALEDICQINEQFDLITSSLGMVNMIDIPEQNQAKDFMQISATI